MRITKECAFWRVPGGLALEDSCLMSLGRLLENAVIKCMHGVRYSQLQVWRIVGSLGFSPQSSEQRTIGRDQVAA